MVDRQTTWFINNVNLIIYWWYRNDSCKRQEKHLIFKIGTIHPHGLSKQFSFI